MHLQCLLSGLTGHIFCFCEIVLSKKILMRTLAYTVCNLAIVELMTSQAIIGLTGRGIHTATAIACENSCGK